MYLRRKSKPYQSRAKKQAGRGFIKNHVGIEERPKIADKKSRVGDWENISCYKSQWCVSDYRRAINELYGFKT